MWKEYDSVAEHFAKHNSLPENISSEVSNEIQEHNEEFLDYVQNWRYALAMESLNLPEDIPNWWESEEGNPVG